MLIGIIYTLAVGNFKKIAKENSTLNLENLKEYLLSFKPTKNVKILCLDDCLSCEIFVDKNHTQTIENFLDESVNIYKYDSLYGYTELEQEVYFNSEDIEEDVCFSYEINKAGVGDQVLVEFKNKFYDYTGYFSKIGVYNSLDKAKEARENLIREVQ